MTKLATKLPAVTDKEASTFDEELEQQRDRTANLFRNGLVPRDRTFTPRMCELARETIEHPERRLGLDPVVVEAVRSGAKPGEPLPSELLEPLPAITGVYDADVRIVGEGEDRRVTVFFSHQAFPGIRFGHRFQPRWGAHINAWRWDEDVWLKENVESGRLDLMMRDQTAADPDGIVWTSFGRS
jgi:hypothetical protein